MSATNKGKILKSNKKKKSYESLNHYFYPLFSWMMPFVVGLVMLIMSIKIDTWTLWPFFTVLLLVSGYHIVKIVRKIHADFVLYCKRYGRKKYVTYVRKTIWVMDFYGIVGLVVLVLMLIAVVTYM